MARIAEDAGLALVDGPTALPTLAPSGRDSLYAGPAGEEPFLVEGERAAAAGAQRGAIEHVVIGGRRVAEAIARPGERAANVLLTPSLARREMIGPAGTGFETVAVPVTLPLVAVQWTGARDESARPAGGRPSAATDSESTDRTPGPNASDTRRVALTVLPDEREIRYRIGPSALVAAPDGGDEALHLSVVPPARRIEVAAGPGGGIRVTIDAHRDSVSLLLAWGRAETARSAFRAAAHLDAHVDVATDDPGDGIRLSTGLSDLDDALTWARVRLRRCLARAPNASADAGSAQAWFWTGIGALAVGDLPSARAALRVLEPFAHHGASSPIGRLPSLLAGRLARAGGGGSGLRAASSSASASDSDAASGPPSAARVRLPMLGRTDAPDTLRWLTAALDGEAPGCRPETTGSTDLDSALSIWASFEEDADSAWNDWRARLSRGHRSGPEGPGTWDLRGPGGVGACPVTGVLLGALAHGLLGLSPDAAVGRIRIAPRIPARLTGFSVEGIRVGEAALRLRHEHADGVHTFELAPTLGRAPPSVVFAPEVPGSVAEVRVDGEVAALALEPVGPRTRVPLQIAADAARVVEIVSA